MARRAAVVFDEKEFYLDEFRGRTLVFAVHHDGGAERLRVLGEALRDMLASDTRVIVILGGAAARGKAGLRALLRPLPPIPAVTEPPVLTLGDAPATPATIDSALLLAVWEVLRASPLLLVASEGSTPDTLTDFAQHLGIRLRVHKLIVVDDAGGVRPPNAPGVLSFIDETMLEALLRRGEAESAGLGARRPLLEAIHRGLRAGIASINLCPLDGVAHELFTYEGSGTLFTREDYCRVAPLALDDFHEVEKLLERGQREGYLKLRSPAEIGHILISGYGATIGEHHLAGVCALETEPYAAERAGEIVGLYTMTRFKGEGVGAKLVEQMKNEGRRLGLAYLFASTTQERVGQFFERQGFRAVPSVEVPAAKWLDYDPARKAAVRVYRFDPAP
ncbi:MAG TPA: GNAT family N-acetyltransferase [Candidatus Binatia bacterium]|jgi:amino-acid N-acetyltransferase